MKKVLSFILSIAVASISVLSAAAADTNSGTGAAEKKRMTYKQISKIKINKNRMYFYPYNLPANNDYMYELRNLTNNTTNKIFFADVYDHASTVTIDNTATYEPMMGLSRAYGGGGTFVYDDADGFYDIIRIKLSNYSNYFNPDGTHTEYNSVLKKDFDYSFVTQNPVDKVTVNSALFFESGAAVTCAVPDENGEVEVVVSRNPKHRLQFSTEFDTVDYRSGSFIGSSGGGKNRQTVPGLRAGDADLDGFVDVGDVTAMQRQLAEYDTFTALQIRNTDFNKDKAITIADVTILQRYLAQYDISEYYKDK